MARVNASRKERANLRLAATSSRKVSDAETMWLPGERGRRDFQRGEAGFGGWDEFSQGGEGLETIGGDGSITGGQDHMNSEGDMGDRFEGIVESSGDISFDTTPAAQQDEGIAADDQVGAEAARTRPLASA